MRIALIADIHSNLAALEAVLADIEAQKIKKILCCGDVIGYAGSPNECCDKIRSLNAPCIAGNHDVNAVTFENIGWFNDDAKAALGWTAGRLTKENRTWLMSLPRIWREKIEGKEIVMVHGSPHDYLYEYVEKGADEKLFRLFLEETKADILVLAHTHVPWIKKIDNKLIINPGAVGQPRDGNNHASYAILDTKKGGVEIRRVGYDIDKETKKILDAGLPRFLAERLYAGV